MHYLPTFNIPNYTERVPQGGYQGYRNAGLPNITGYFYCVGGVNSYRNGFRGFGAFFGAIPGIYRAGTSSEAGEGYADLHIDASYSSPIYGSSDTVQPPACGSNFFIKY